MINEQVEPEVKEPRILIYDIETTPLVSLTWGTYDQNVIRVQEDWHILCFAYKWLGESETHIVSQRQWKKAYKKDMTDDSKVVGALHKLLSEADISIAHNGVRFDDKKVNARFMHHKMEKPQPRFSIDTLQILRRHAKLTSNKLNDVCQQFGIGKKVPHHGIDTWIGCMAGVDAEWDIMEKYNIMDVDLLEQLYIYLLSNGWIDQHPNMAIISGHSDSCKACGAHVTQMQKRGIRRTTAYQYQQYQCKICKTYQRGRTAIKGSRALFA